jgi:hypothetical protein
VQPHEPPVCVFEQGVVGDQALSVLEGERDMSFGLEARSDFSQRVAPRAAPLLTGNADPLGEIGAIRVVQRPQQFAAARSRIGAQAL